MSVVSASTEIAASPARVWEMVMDPRRLEEWVTIHRRLVRADDLPPRVGFQMDQQIHLRGVNLQVRWTLALERPGSDARIERVGPGRPRVLAGLCTTCSRSTHGTLRLGRKALAALLNGRSAVVVATPAGTARGVLKLQLPARR